MDSLSLSFSENDGWFAGRDWGVKPTDDRVRDLPGLVQRRTANVGAHRVTAPWLRI